mgnify:CR=1 FL=1
MKGSPKPDGDGGWIIPDGSLAKAVRLAATDSVCLFLDEVPRLYETAKEWLLPFLTGVKITDASGDTELFYSLTTARPDGAGALEKITCPARNLHIICAGNLERRIPDAFWSRFRPYRIEFDKAQIAATSAAILNHYGIEAHGLPSMYSELVDESRKARAICEYWKKLRAFPPTWGRLTKAPPRWKSRSKSETLLADGMPPCKVNTRAKETR